MPSEIKWKYYAEMIVWVANFAKQVDSKKKTNVIFLKKMRYVAKLDTGTTFRSTIPRKYWKTVAKTK